MLIIIQFWRSLNYGALGNGLSRHGLATALVVIQAIGSGMNEETLMKATHPMIRLGQFGICTKLVEAIGHCLHILINHKSH